jgi:high-affinity K+ transport system ATPase subunit B
MHGTTCHLLWVAILTSLSVHGLQSDGHTCVMVAVEGRLAAAVSLFDPVKAEARGVVTALHTAGLQCHLLTGDNRCAKPLGGSAPGACSPCSMALANATIEQV